MARKLPLGDITIAGDTINAGELMLAMLRNAQQRGITFDQMVKAVAAMRPIELAIEAGSSEVLLEDEHWTMLCQRLSEYPFAVADQSIVDFGLALRNAPHADLTESPGENKRKAR